jgi:hypothetical protein
MEVLGQDEHYGAQRLRQENHKFKVSLGYIKRSCLKKTNSERR